MEDVQCCRCSDAVKRNVMCDVRYYSDVTGSDVRHEVDQNEPSPTKQYKKFGGIDFAAV